MLDQEPENRRWEPAYELNGYMLCKPIFCDEKADILDWLVITPNNEILWAVDEEEAVQISGGAVVE